MIISHYNKDNSLILNFIKDSKGLYVKKFSSPMFAFINFISSTVTTLNEDSLMPREPQNLILYDKDDAIVKDVRITFDIYGAKNRNLKVKRQIYG